MQIITFVLESKNAFIVLISKLLLLDFILILIIFYHKT